jgi:hypothetical protein
MRSGKGPQIAPGELAAERESFGEVVLVGRLREAIRRLNPAIPEEAREEALRKVLRVGSPALVQTNRAFHRMLRDGTPVEYPRPDGSIAGDHERLVDFDKEFEEITEGEGLTKKESLEDRARSGGIAVSLLGGQQHIAARNGR